MRGEQGFSLVEAVAAMALVVVVVAAVSTALVTGRAMAGYEREQAVGRAAARARLATLSSLPFSTIAGIDGAPVAVTDTTSDVASDPIGSGGTGLGPSPADALWVDRAGYVDYLDATGRGLGSGAVARARAAYVRRWAIGRPAAATGAAAAPGAGEVASITVLVAPVSVAARASARDPTRIAGEAGVVVYRGARSREAS